jgi:hypothetical protein
MARQLLRQNCPLRRPPRPTEQGIRSGQSLDMANGPGRGAEPFAEGDAPSLAPTEDCPDPRICGREASSRRPSVPSRGPLQRGSRFRRNGPRDMPAASRSWSQCALACSWINPRFTGTSKALPPEWPGFAWVDATWYFDARQARAAIERVSARPVSVRPKTLSVLSLALGGHRESERPADVRRAFLFVTRNRYLSRSPPAMAACAAARRATGTRNGEQDT